MPWGTWREIGVNVVSDFVYWLLVTLFGLLFLGVHQLSKRRMLLRFFGLKESRPRLRVYLSNLDVLSGGAKDFRGERAEYAGPATPESELEIIPPLTQLFAHPILDQLGIVRELLGKRFWVFRKLEPSFELSPFDQAGIQFDNIVSAGSSRYNSVTDYYQTEYDPTVILDHDLAHDRERCIVINYGARRGQPIPVARGRDMGILARVYDPHHDTVVFIGAGFHINGTLGAIRYLIDHWQELAKEYERVESWAICLDFPRPSYDPRGYLRPTVITRVPQPERRQSLLDRFLRRRQRSKEVEMAHLRDAFYRFLRGQQSYKEVQVNDLRDIVELREVDSAEQVNELLASGWSLLLICSPRASNDSGTQRPLYVLGKGTPQSRARPTTDTASGASAGFGWECLQSAASTGAPTETQPWTTGREFPCSGGSLAGLPAEHEDRNAN